MSFDTGPGHPPVLPPRSILIVDDEVDVLALLATVFEHNGFEVITATNAADAIALAVASLPGVIVLNMHLPRGNGLIVAAALNREESTRNIPIIAISGDVTMRERALAAGCRTYFRKPISPMALVAEATHWLKRDKS